jgi:hypothetical protein
MHLFFKTDKFRQVLDDDEIGRVVLGEDCLEWFRAQLSIRNEMMTQRLVFEDWGWTMGLTVNGLQLWLNVQDWSFEQPQTWHLWIEPRGILARIRTGRYAAARTRLRQVIDEAISHEAAIREPRWSDAIPR